MTERSKEGVCLTSFENMEYDTALLSVTRRFMAQNSEFIQITFSSSFIQSVTKLHKKINDILLDRFNGPKAPEAVHNNM